MKKMEKKREFKGLGGAYTHFRQQENVTEEDTEVMARFVDAVSTVSLCPAEVGEQDGQRNSESSSHEKSLQ